MDSIEWANARAAAAPRMLTDGPGSRSIELYARMTRHTAGSLSPTASTFPVAFEQGDGVVLTDVDGNTYLDFSSGGLVTNLGHGHPSVVAAISRVAAELDAAPNHATPYRVAALEKLASITPPGMTLFTLLSSTYEALQAAQRVVRAATGRADVLAEIDLAHVSDLCIPSAMQQLAEAARARGGLFVADELATGMGRTGAWFAVDAAGVVPDVMAIGKCLGNGFPVTAIAVKETHADALEASAPHPSHGGNPMACAALAAVIDTTQRELLIEHTAAFGEHAIEHLETLAARHPLVGRAWGRGALLGFDMVDPETGAPSPRVAEAVMRRAFSHGVAWTALGHVLLLTPPIVMTIEVFLRGLEIIDEAVTAVEKDLGH
jgi:4-aminobutyrate aminotransferase-like enzyme